MKKSLLKILLAIIAITYSYNSFSQCPAITCPSNITVNNDPGLCSAVVNYTPPVGTDPCFVGGATTFNYTGAIVNWTVPAGVTSGRIEVRGAEGGTHSSSAVPGGLGAIMIGDFVLTPASTLKILVGQKHPAGNGGGGGSFVTTNTNVPLIIAGGGGGSGSGNNSVTKHGQVGNNGGAGSGGGGSGGTGGNGGNKGPSGFQSGAGGGLLTDGIDGWAANTRGRSFINGGAGGAIGWGIGGFGGGGNGSMYVVGGGGGGYSGGASASNFISPGGVGGGGGSYNSGTNQSNTGGANTGHGLVIITTGGAVTTTQTAGLPSGATFPVGTTTNTFVVSNGTQTATCSFTVTVLDAEVPIINCPANITVNNDPGMCNAIVNYTTPVGTDNCPGATTSMTTGLASGSTFPIGTTTQTYSVTDAANNTVSCSFTVTVIDAEAPTLTCPANVVSCNPIVNGIAPTSSDNCPGNVVTYNLTGATIGSGNNDASGTTFNVGITTVTYTATDASNNIINCSFTVTINPIPTVTVPANATYCNGDPVPASAFTSIPAGGTFAWTNSNTSIGLAAAGTGNTPAFNAVNTGSTPVTATITVTPTANGCVGLPVTYTITVNPTPTVTVPANATYCNGDPVPASAFTSIPAGGTFAWTNSNTTIGLAAAGTSNTPAFNAINTGTTPVTATITVTPTANGCVGLPVTYTITVNPTPTVTVPVNATYCNGDPVPASAFTSIPAGGTFAWTNSNTTIGLATAGTGNTPAFNAINTGSTPVTATITVTPTANGCVGLPVTYTITVNPTPTVTVPANATYCNGDPVPASAFTSIPAGATFAWTNSNTTIGLAAAGTGNTPAFNAINTGSTPVTATITVTPTANGCVGLPVTYTITVNPTPAAPTAANVTICPNNSATLTATAPGGTYEWYDAPVAGTLLVTNASYTTPVLIANMTYYVQTTLNGCVSPRTPVTVTIAPALVVNAGLDDTICSGATYTLGVNPNGPGYSYVWDELPAPLNFSNIFNPIVSPTTTTTYVVTVTDANNCVGSDSVVIYIKAIFFIVFLFFLLYFCLFDFEPPNNNGIPKNNPVPIPAKVTNELPRANFSVSLFVADGSGASFCSCSWF